jgi:hypothetical protein
MAKTFKPDYAKEFFMPRIQKAPKYSPLVVVLLVL